MAEEPIENGGETEEKPLDTVTPSSEPKKNPFLSEEINRLRRESEPNCASIGGTTLRGQDWTPSDRYFLNNAYTVYYKKRTFVAPNPNPLPPMGVNPEGNPPNPEVKPGIKKGQMGRKTVRNRC